MNALVWIWRLPALLMIGLARAYQRLLSPILGKQCRFHPTCSEYFILAIQKYGALSGSVRGIWRVFRCHPFNRGGYDPP